MVCDKAKMWLCQVQETRMAVGRLIINEEIWLSLCDDKSITSLPVTLMTLGYNTKFPRRYCLGEAFQLFFLPTT